MARYEILARLEAINLSTDQPQQTVEDRERVRRAAGDVEIDRQEAIGPVMDLGIASKRSAGDRTSPNRDYNLRRRHGIVGFLQGHPHVLGHRACDQ